jgi:hypothetical protein
MTDNAFFDAVWKNDVDALHVALVGCAEPNARHPRAVDPRT